VIILVDEALQTSCVWLISLLSYFSSKSVSKTSTEDDVSKTSILVLFLLFLPVVLVTGVALDALGRKQLSLVTRCAFQSFVHNEN
jgi:cytochrome b subunit of formate dehydrogenase